MNFLKRLWIDGEKVRAQDLNRIEDGVELAHSRIDGEAITLQVQNLVQGFIDAGHVVTSGEIEGDYLYLLLGDGTRVQAGRVKGDAGGFTSITVGPVTTLPEGSAASVTVVGEPGARELRFSLPTGPRGTQGDVGTVYQLGNRSGNLDLSTYKLTDILHINLTGALVITGMPAVDASKGGTITLVISGNGFGVTWPSAFASYGVKPSLSAGASPDLFQLASDGVRWWVLVGAFAGAPVA